MRRADVANGVVDEDRTPDYGADWDEGPRQRVEVSEFQIAMRQVSMEQLAQFQPGYRKRLEEHHVEWMPESPAVLVSWDEANLYCQWISKLKGKVFRLPTESEWELAASQTGQLRVEGIADGVQEWCYDWWAPYAADENNAMNPCGPKVGSVRVVRDGGGGSVLEKTREAVPDFRVTDRSATLPGDMRTNLGFRIVSGPNLLEVDEENEVHELRGTPFNDVTAQKCDWETPDDKAAAFFWAGGKFIEPGTGSSAAIPYWSRHHVPSITYCDNGDLLATAFTAPFDNSDQMAILITRLRHGKKKWDPAARFFVAPDRNITSAALFNTGNGVIHHYNGLGINHCEDFSMFKRTSQDNGATWSEPKIVHRFPVNAATPENPTGKPRLWPHMDLKLHNAANGDRILMMSTDVGAGNELGTAIFTSRDDGESWQELTRTGWQSENFGATGRQAGWVAGIHAPVELLGDGSLLAIGRSNDIDGFSPLSHSSDFGKTWTYEASSFPPILSGQRTVLMRLKEGPLLFISFTDSSVNVREKKVKGMDFVDSTGTLSLIHI